MSVTIGKCDEVPTPQGHTGFRYAMDHGDGETTLSDNLSELIAKTIPGYDRFGDDDEGHDSATFARAQHMAQVASAVQASLIREAVAATPGFDPGSASDDVLTALSQDRRLPFEGVSSPDGAICHEWTESVPLVLVSTDYHPFTVRVAPTGEVVLLDPSTELTYLLTLHSLGLIGFCVKPGADRDLSDEAAQASSCV